MFLKKYNIKQINGYLNILYIQKLVDQAKFVIKDKLPK